jgi:hypothetical protein
MDSLVPRVSVFIGQGDEGSAMGFASKGSKVKSGFWVGKNDTFNVMAELVNYKPTSQEIYITMEYEYLSMPSRPKDYYSVGMGAVNVAPCAKEQMCKTENKARNIYDIANKILSPCS